MNKKEIDLPIICHCYQCFAIRAMKARLATLYKLRPYTPESMTKEFYKFIWEKK